MANIFSGIQSAEPLEICDTLGWMNHDLGEDGSKLIGAVMTLCRFVRSQEIEIERLKARIEHLEGKQ